ncbi:hypothetical protein [Nonomuraea sp. NPDC050310]|uniref:hypothetical protein n=1 Tax=Nonomuraea sp. NPDC050310 TaxID=3154935 RepID=UPI0034020323
MTDTHAELAELPAAPLDFDAYHVFAEDLVPGQLPRLTLTCPPGHCPDDHTHCPVGDCVYDLIPAAKRGSHIALGTLLDLAIKHDVERRGGVEGVGCGVADAAGVRELRVQVAERLAQLRAVWCNRLQVAVCDRDASDGATAAAASVRVDVLRQCIADLDAALCRG